MNVGAQHVCIEAFGPSLVGDRTHVESLAVLSALNKEWNKLVATSMRSKKMNIINAVLKFVDNDGQCTLSNTTFNISETKLDIDAMCCFFRKLAVWKVKSQSRPSPDISILYTNKMFIPKQHDDKENDCVMNTMRLLIAGTFCEFFDEKPALKVCWMYLMCNFIKYALLNNIYVDLFRSETFAIFVKRKVSTYREFLRINKGIPSRLRWETDEVLRYLHKSIKHEN